MTYSSTTHDGVVIEEYITGRILRITHGEHSFKLFAQSEGDASVAIYLGHGQLTAPIRAAIRAWAAANGIKIALWGRDKQLTTTCKSKE